MSKAGLCIVSLRSTYELSPLHKVKIALMNRNNGCLFDRRNGHGNISRRKKLIKHNETKSHYATYCAMLDWLRRLHSNENCCLGCFHFVCSKCLDASATNYSLDIMMARDSKQNCLATYDKRRHHTFKTNLIVNHQTRADITGTAKIKISDLH